MHKAKAAAYKNIKFAVIYRVYILRAFVDLFCLSTKCFCYFADIRHILQGVLIAIGPEICPITCIGKRQSRPLNVIPGKRSTIGPIEGASANAFIFNKNMWIIAQPYETQTI